MAYKRGLGGGSYIAHKSCNCVAIVWAMQMSGGDKGMIDSYTNGLTREGVQVNPILSPCGLAFTRYSFTG